MLETDEAQCGPSFNVGFNPHGDGETQAFWTTEPSRSSCVDKIQCLRGDTAFA